MSQAINVPQKRKNSRVRIHKRSVRWLGGMIAMACLSAGGQAQMLPLLNADFEDGPIGQTPTGWTVTQGDMYTTDGVGLGGTDPTGPDSAGKFLSGSWQAIPGVTSSPYPDSQSMGIHQVLDLSPYAAQIQTGRYGVDLSFAYSDGDVGDYGTVSISFRDGRDRLLGAATSYSTLNNATAINQWKTRTISGPAPPTTQTVRIELHALSNGAGTARNISFDALSAELGIYTPPPPRDLVHGRLIQFNPNGAWCWYQDERAIVDTQRGTLVIGSIANFAGLGGNDPGPDGLVQATHFNLADGSRTIHTLNDIETGPGGDDHNVPGLLKKEDGNIIAFYAAHNHRNGHPHKDDVSYTRSYDVYTGTWGTETEYHWWPVIPDDAPGSGGTTYANVFQLAAEDPDGDGHGRIYNIARTQQSPHIMYSDDNGTTWEYGGQLTQQAADKPTGSNYVNGYYKYASNGTDRIDMIATEYHPRNFNTSIYHAYISNGKLYDSQGKEIDDDIFDAATSFAAANVVTSTDHFTQIFQAGTTENSRAWNTDLQSYADGVITALFKARAGAYVDGDHTIGREDHRVWFARFDPQTQQWTSHEIGKAGANLFGTFESDYTGLGALDPSDPDVVYISTEINPITDKSTDHHEIYKGVTADGGASWTWTAITENSSYDNLRPIVPAWDDGHTALLWYRGQVNSARNFDTAIVGLILSDDQRLGARHYVDADATNTTLADGSPLPATTGPEPDPPDDAWALRTGVANLGSVYASGEVAAEDAPLIKTSVDSLDASLYDVFAYFWIADTDDWRLQAGLSPEGMMIFRKRGAQHADTDTFSRALLTAEANRDLYQAYLGRVDLADGESLSVYIDDDTGDGSGPIWYDGLGFARVYTGLIGDFN